MKVLTKQYFIIILFIGIIIGNAYYFGSNPDNSIVLFIFYLFGIVWNISYFLVIATIRTLVNSISDLLIRNDIAGYSERKIALNTSVSQFLFFSSWWVTIIVFLLLYPLAQSVDVGLFFTFLIIIFLIGDFIVRQLSLNWVWKHKTNHWSYSYSTQTRFVLRHLIIAPILIFISLFYNLNIYEIDTKPSLGEGWGWYLFSFFGFMSISHWFIKLYQSLYEPANAWIELERLTHEELK